MPERRTIPLKVQLLNKRYNLLFDNRRCVSVRQNYHNFGLVALALCWIACCSPTFSWAQPTIEQVSYWENKNGQGELEIALNNVFYPTKPDFLNLSEPNSVHWIRLRLTDLSDTIPYFLATDSYHLEQITLFTQTADGQWKSVRNDTARFTMSRRMVLLDLKNYEPGSFAYLRLRITRPTRLQLSVYTESDFRAMFLRERNIFYGLFTTLLVLVCLLLTRGIRSRTYGYIWLGLALLAAGVYVAAINGLWLDYGLRLSPENDERLQNIASGLLFFGLIRFVRYWQQTHRNLPDLDLFARFMEGGNLLIAGVSFFFVASFFTQVCFLNALFSSNLVFFLLLLRRAHGHEYLGIAVSGAYLGAMGFLMMILRLYGVIAISFLNLHSIAFGLALQFLCLGISFFRTPPCPN